MATGAFMARATPRRSPSTTGADRFHYSAYPSAPRQTSAREADPKSSSFRQNHPAPIDARPKLAGRVNKHEVRRVVLVAAAAVPGELRVWIDGSCTVDGPIGGVGGDQLVR